MARMIPSVISPNTGSPGEQEIFRKLSKDTSTRDWIVLHSLDIADHNTQVAGEIDFIVIVPNKGVLCVEVKSQSTVGRDPSAGLWHLGRKTEARGPFKQASDAMHTIRTMVASAQADLRRIVFWSAVVFPFSEFSMASPEWHTWQVIDKYKYREAPFSKLIEDVLDHARDFLVSENQAAAWFKPDRNEPSIEQCKTIASILRPSFEYINSFRSQLETLNSELRFYTEEQFDALDALEDEPRVSFEGPAGTGKTLLALESARRARARGRKVLLICFNKLLGKWLEREADSFSPEVTTRTLHKHMLEVSGETVPNGKPSTDDDPFWTNYLPVAAAEALPESVGDHYLYDEIIIDEAQDIIWIDRYLDFIQFSLRGELSDGRWVFFGDYEKQVIYSNGLVKPKDVLKGRGFPPSHFHAYRLTRNCWNTPRIAETVRVLGGLDPGYKKVLRPDNGVEPEFIFYKSDNDQLAWLADVLDRLITEGFRGDDIVVLSSRTDADCAAAKVAQAPWKGRLRPFWQATKGQIGYGSIYSFKGLEAPVVIVTDIHSINGKGDQDLFYVGITRAVNNLILITHMNVKNEIGQMLTRTHMYK